MKSISALRDFQRVRRFKRLSGLPWSALLEAALIARGRWRALPLRQRRRLLDLLRRSRGWPPNLTAAERTEVRRLAAGIDAKGLARELLALRRSRRGRRRRAGARFRSSGR